MSRVKMSIVLFRVLGSALLLGGLPLTARGDMINGTTTGSTVSTTVTYFGVRESVTATTINMSYFTNCNFITQGLTAEGFNTTDPTSPNYYVFAGTGVASGVANIAASDFTISQYAPWVANNNATTNNVTGPDGANYFRSVTNSPDGGANIVISYTPTAGSDPTSVNFVQAYIQSRNGGGFTTGILDNGGANTPFYNQKGVAGTGTTNQTGTVPLMTSVANPPTPATSAWMLDMPYDSLVASTSSSTVTFQTFIEGQQNIGGTNYNVLYGGVQWGYTFKATAIPEPATVVMVSQVGVMMLLAYSWRRGRAKG